MADRRPIPIPFRLRWREFRYRWLPLIVFLLVLLIAADLWQNHVNPPGLIGRAHVRRAEVTVPTDGKLLTLTVKPFEPVARGQVLATVRPKGSRTQLDALRLRLDLIRMQLDPDSQRNRTEINYQRLRLEWYEQRVTLAAAQVDLQRAENELARDTRLYQEQLLSLDQFDLSQKRVESLRAEVEETTGLVTDMGQSLEQLYRTGPGAESEEAPDWFAESSRTLDRALTEFERLSQPYEIKAPVDGKVGIIERIAGEHLLKGDRFLTITENETSHAVVWVESVSRYSLSVGAPVRVRTRGDETQEAMAQIAGIGPEWVMSGTRSWRSAEADSFSPSGIQVLLTLPAELKVFPGEPLSVFFLDP